MSTYNPERRAFLRGMLIAGCALCVPMAWGAETSTGETKKSGESEKGSEKKGKMSKAQAKYQTHPNGDKKCENCLNFIAPSSCKLVAGKISATGYCMLWAKKA